MADEKQYPRNVPPINATVPEQRKSARLNLHLAEAPIKATTSNSPCTPFASHNIISQETVTFFADQIYHNKDTTRCKPSWFITASPTNINNKYDVDIKHLCNRVVHPVTGETMTQYNNSKMILPYNTYGPKHPEKSLVEWHKVTTKLAQKELTLFLCCYMMKLIVFQ